MATIPEQISNVFSNSQGKPDANLSNDSNNLGGIPANDYATKEYVQNYHDTKESNQKEYIDSQDQKILEQAKEYVNSSIRNQDFSDFAKISDVQALDKKLSEDITEGLTGQKNYTDSKIQEVVKHTNDNFSDVTNSIKTLNGTVNDLFQSVSSGKSKIAGAITDKGVPTSANDSYDTMASNIRAISTGGGGSGEPGGEIPEGYYNTSDANITASDVLLGKVAYGSNGKIIGSLTQIPGTGTDTSNATATAADIAEGKTAYARGQFLVGTMKSNSNIQEIYSGNGSQFEKNTGTTMQSTFPYTDNGETVDEVSYRTKVTYSKDMARCVSIVYLTKDKNNNDKTNWNDGKDFVVESLGVNSNGLYLSAYAGGSGETYYKKFRYKKEELNLGENETVTDIFINSPGVLTDDYTSLLFILTIDSTDSKKYIHVYTYREHEHGYIIGTGSESFSFNAKFEYTYPSDYTSGTMFAFNTFTRTLGVICNKSGFTTRTRSFMFRAYNFNILYGANGKPNISMNVYDSDEITNENFSIYTAGIGNIVKLTQDDRYILPSFNNNDQDDSVIYAFDIEGTVPNLIAVGELKVSNIGTVTKDENDTGDMHTGNYMTTYLPNTNKIVICRGVDAGLYTLSISGTSITVNLEKVLHLGGTNSSNSCLGIGTSNIDNSRLYLVTAKINQRYSVGSYYYSATALYFNAYDISNIFNLENNETINRVSQTSMLLGIGESKNNVTDCFHIFLKNNPSNTFFIVDNVGSSNTKYALETFTDVGEEKNIVGVNYKGQFFAKIRPEMLSAGGADVKAGKTFIGWAGTVETGTLEVNG